ncbi:MAG: DPP IV N-terminal domain-containing protein [Bacteroidetes bacterium]|nr:DPP IV N-terminal domain-containing protein [Bacteroidota bacterium]
MRKVSILIIFLLPFIVSSKTKMLTIEEAVLKQRNTLAPQKLEQLNWVSKSNNYFFVGYGTNKNWLMIGNAEKGKPERKISLSEINKQLRDSKFDTLSVFPTISCKGSTINFKDNKYKAVIDLLSKKANFIPRDIPKEAENIEERNVESDSDVAAAYTIDNNLYVWSDGKQVKVTNDAERNVVNGKSVHRDEWGINKGTFWSPKGNYLAFYRMDQTMVTDYPIIDFTKQPARAENIKYPMAGGKSHEVTVGVFDMKTHKTVFLKTGEPKEQFLTNIAWSPDENHIYIAILNRVQNHLWLNCYNGLTGDFEKTLFEEKDDKYVHPMHPLQFVKKHDDQFIWQSERDGYNNVYLYNTNGKLIRQLTNYTAPNVRRAYSVECFNVLGFDDKGEKLFYIGINSRKVLGREIRFTKIDGSVDDTIASGEGTHSAILSSDGKYFLDTYSSVSIPKSVNVISSAGKRIQNILTAVNPLKDYKLGQMRLFTLTAADNSTSLYCRMILPVDFDSTKKYPAIVYLYNGPNVQLITNTWLAGSDLWFQYMAEHGYIIFTVDGRGSGNRGLKFEQATFRNLGMEEMNDQLKGVEFLKSKNYVDANRLGVYGWSYGGFMTTSLMTRHAGIFKTAVAGGPVIDWSYYEVMYTERYMDTPQENQDGYKNSSLLSYAENLKGKLLLIHGTSDDVVVWQHSILFLKKCVEKGTQPDYFVYPGHLHNVLGKDRVHLYEKITDYFMTNL